MIYCNTGDNMQDDEITKVIEIFNNLCKADDNEIVEYLYTICALNSKVFLAGLLAYTITMYKSENKAKEHYMKVLQDTIDKLERMDLNIPKEM
jgi:hypothetical protein